MAEKPIFVLLSCEILDILPVLPDNTKALIGSVDLHRKGLHEPWLGRDKDPNLITILVFDFIRWHHCIAVDQVIACSFCCLDNDI